MRLPPYPVFPNISGEKISLRQIRTEDLEVLKDISFYDAVQARTLEQAIQMHKKICRDYDAGNSIHWGIVDEMTGQIVGTCGYYRGFEQGVGELGCVLLPDYRGQGHMTAALLLAIDFGLQTIGLYRIRAVTSQQNKKALKLLERLNFVQVSDSDPEEIEFLLKAT